MNRSTRSIAIAVAGFAAIALLAVAARASAATAPHRCLTGNVTISLRHPLAALGNDGATIRLRNEGASACTVTGYPRLGLESASGLPVKSSTHRGDTYFSADPGPTVITLARGETAVAHFAYGNDGAYGAVVASSLTVRVKGASRHRTVTLPGAPADVFAGKLRVTAWIQERK